MVIVKEHQNPYGSISKIPAPSSTPVHLKSCHAATFGPNRSEMNAKNISVTPRSSRLNLDAASRESMNDIKSTGSSSTTNSLRKITLGPDVSTYRRRLANESSSVSHLSDVNNKSNGYVGTPTVKPKVTQNGYYGIFDNINNKMPSHTINSVSTSNNYFVSNNVCTKSTKNQNLNNDFGHYIIKPHQSTAINQPKNSKLANGKTSDPFEQNTPRRRSLGKGGGASKFLAEHLKLAHKPVNLIRRSIVKPTVPLQKLVNHDINTNIDNEIIIQQNDMIGSNNNCPKILKNDVTSQHEVQRPAQTLLFARNKFLSFRAPRNFKPFGVDAPRRPPNNSSTGVCFFINGSNDLNPTENTPHYKDINDTIKSNIGALHNYNYKSTKETNGNLDLGINANFNKPEQLFDTPPNHESSGSPNFPSSSHRRSLRYTIPISPVSRAPSAQPPNLSARLSDINQKPKPTTNKRTSLSFYIPIHSDDTKNSPEKHEYPFITTNSFITEDLKSQKSSPKQASASNSPFKSFHESKRDTQNSVEKIQEILHNIRPPPPVDDSDNFHSPTIPDKFSKKTKHNRASPHVHLNQNINSVKSFNTAITKDVASDTLEFEDIVDSEANTIRASGGLQDFASKLTQKTQFFIPLTEPKPLSSQAFQNDFIEKTSVDLETRSSDAIANANSASSSEDLISLLKQQNRLLTLEREEKIKIISEYEDRIKALSEKIDSQTSPTLIGTTKFSCHNNNFDNYNNISNNNNDQTTYQHPTSDNCSQCPHINSITQTLNRMIDQILEGIYHFNSLSAQNKDLKAIINTKQLLECDTGTAMISHDHTNCPCNQPYSESIASNIRQRFNMTPQENYQIPDYTTNQLIDYDIGRPQNHTYYRINSIESLNDDDCTYSVKTYDHG